jgi:phytoene dehydrogenase-like protein
VAGGTVDTDVIVVGAGHNGLVAAWYLAKAGLRVQMFERRPWVGGAAITQELWPGFRFSTCAHSVHALHPKIIRDLGLRHLGFEVLPRTFPDLLLKPDGTYYGPAEHDSPRNLGFSARLTVEERQGEQALGEFKRRLVALVAPYRLRVPPTFAELRARAAGTAAAVFEQAITRTASQIRERFLPTARLLDRHATEKGMEARDPLALSYAYEAIDAVDEETGEAPPVGYVRGGMGVLTRLLAQAAEAAGVTINVGHEAARFLVEGGEVIGIRLAGGAEVRSRVVLSNLDPKRTFLRLFEPQHLDAGFRRRVAGLVTAVSCVKLLAAISELPRWKDWDGDPASPSGGKVGLHRMRSHIAAAWDDMDAGRPPREMVINVSVPSAVDASLAPRGAHTASCYIYPAPATLREGTWEDAREAVTERIIDQITHYAPNFRGSVLNCKLRTPLDLETENGLTDGCITHLEQGGEQLLWNRPLPELAHYRAPLRGLYLCGSGQHPGGEVSGQPGHNAAHEVLRDGLG